MPQPWILSIDFGTSYTLVVAKVGDRTPEVLEIGGERRMPSVVMVESSGGLLVGRTADDLSGANPASTLRAPKSRLGDQAPVVLAGRPYPVVDLVAGLLRHVYEEAVSQVGEPPTEVRLTHPATWNRPRMSRLLDAAAKAGLPNPALVPEPVAAALSYASESGVPDGSHLAVYDLGGGTFDTAVVTARRGGFVVEGRPSGDQNIGGELFDELVVNHIGERLPPEAWEQIQVADSPTWQQVGASLRKEARRAKETLSSHPYADVLVPLPDGLEQLRITREEFEQIVGPYIDETVTLLRRCIDDAGVDIGKVASIYLVGGASRSPIVERLVRAAFPNVNVSRRGDPKTSVALGAARAVRSSSTTGLSSGQRGSSDPALQGSSDTARLSPPSGPTSNPSGPPAAVPTSDPPRPTAPVSGESGRVPFPTTSAPPAATGSNPPQSVSSLRPAPTVPPPAATTPHYLGSPTAPAKPGRRMSGKAVALIIGAAVLVGAIVGIVLVSSGDDSSPTTTERIPRETDEPEDSTTLSPADIATALRNVMYTPEQVQAAFGTAWTENTEYDPNAEGVELCDFEFSVDAELRIGRQYSLDDLTVWSNVGRFPDEGDAADSIAQDKAFILTCTEPFTTTFTDDAGNEYEYTVQLVDAFDTFSYLGEDTLAISYTATPTDTTLVTLTGYIVEWRVGQNIVSSEFSGADNDVSDDIYGFNVLLADLRNKTRDLP